MASSCHFGVIDSGRNRYRMWPDTKTARYARGVNKSCKMITFSHLNSSNFNDNFKDNCMLEEVKSILVVLILSFAPFLFFIIFTFGSVLKLLFDDFFHIAFGYTVS